MAYSAERMCLEAFGMLKKELFFSPLFAVETLRKLLSIVVKCVPKTSALTASRCSGLNVADSIEVGPF